MTERDAVAAHRDAVGRAVADASVAAESGDAAAYLAACRRLAVVRRSGRPDTGKIVVGTDGRTDTGTVVRPCETVADAVARMERRDADPMRSDARARYAARQGLRDAV